MDMKTGANGLISGPFRTMAPLMVAVLCIQGCLNPADEILLRSNQGGKLIFVREPNTGRGKNAQMSNIEEFVAGTDLVMLSPISPAGELRNLTARWTGSEKIDVREKGAALDPELSYDGKRLLFSMREQSSRQWRLYELILDNDSLIRLTEPPPDRHDMDPAYLPDGRIVFTSTRPGFVDEYERRPSPVLHVGRRDADGTLTDIRQLSFNQSHDMNPFVHSSGKIYFSRWEHLGDVNKVSLFTINPDGSGLFVLYGSHTPRESGSRAFVEARELLDGGLVSSVMERASDHEGGALAVIDISKSEDNLVFITGDRSPFNTNRQRSEAIFKTPIGIVDGARERVLAAMSPHPVGGNVEGDADYGIYVMDKDGANRRLIYNSSGYHEYDPVPVVARSTPASIPMSSAVSKGLSSGATTGMFFDANVYSRDPTDRQMIPDSGYVNRDGSKGQARYLRLLEAIPLPVNRGARGGDIGHTNFEKQRVLGYADIREDGSFSVEVPANVSMHMQTLDEDGLMLVNQLTWVQVVPGERRLCTGCHGPHDQDKTIFDLHVNETSQEVRFKDLKTYLAGFHNAQKAHEHPAVRKDTLEFGDLRIGADRNGSIQGIFDSRCISCHGRSSASAQGGGLVLDEIKNDSIYRTEGVSTVYDRLLRQRGHVNLEGERMNHVDRNGARKSPLIWVLYGRETDLDQKSKPQYRKGSYDHSVLWAKDSSGAVDPFLPGNVDLLKIIEWLDMGAQFSNTTGYEWNFEKEYDYAE